MKDIIGLPIDFDFKSLSKLSDLIYFDGPLLSHFMNSNGDNYLFYWVDADDDANRWLVVRVGLPAIQQYIKRKKTLFDLLHSSLEATVVIADINTEIECVNAICTTMASLPEEYLPDIDCFYTFQPDLSAKAYEILRLFDRSSLEIHLTGHNVGYGEMHYEDFVNVNQKLFSLWDRLSDKYYVKLCEAYKANNQKRSVPLGKKEEFRKIMQMDYSYAMAGSVRIVLTPRDRTYDFAPSSTDAFIQEFSNVIECGNTIERIREYTVKYGPEVMYDYKELVDLSCDKQLNIGVVHYCHADKSSRTVAINNTNKTRIAENLSNEVCEVEEIEIVGRFYSINTKNFKYGFSSVEDHGEKSDGSFEPIIRHLVPNFSFTKLYKVRISRNIKQKMTKCDQNYDKMFEISEIKPDQDE